MKLFQKKPNNSGSGYDRIVSANRRSGSSGNNTANEQKKDRSALRIVFCALLLTVILCFAARLFNWQIIHGEEYKKLSAASTSHTVTSDATRGEILDVNGVPYAVNETAYNVVINKVYSSDESKLNLIIIDLLNILNECGEKYID